VTSLLPRLKQYFFNERLKDEIVNKANLLDMFGLSGDPATDDELGALLFRLESEISSLSEPNPMAGILQSMTYRFDA
jgi:hypothetical protein